MACIYESMCHDMLVQVRGRLCGVILAFLICEFRAQTQVAGLIQQVATEPSISHFISGV